MSSSGLSRQRSTKSLIAYLDTYGTIVEPLHVLKHIQYVIDSWAICAPSDNLARDNSPREPLFEPTLTIHNHHTISLIENCLNRLLGFCINILDKHVRLESWSRRSGALSLGMIRETSKEWKIFAGHWVFRSSQIRHGNYILQLWLGDHELREMEWHCVVRSMMSPIHYSRSSNRLIWIDPVSLLLILVAWPQ